VIRPYVRFVSFASFCLCTVSFSDQTAVGLQAADFSAGFLRRQLIDSFNEQETPDPPWSAKMSEIGILGKLWETNEMVELAKARPDFGSFMQIRAD
jgi:hypothetical protein